MKQNVHRLIILFLFIITFTTHIIYAKQLLINWPDGKQQLVVVEPQEQWLIAEGDIILNNINKQSAIVIKPSNDTRWHQNTLPFRISAQMPTKNKLSIYQAMLEIARHSNLRFQELDEQDSMTDFVYFKPSDSTICASHVGRKGGMQEIILAPRCAKGSTMHEILHALGIWHEQSRIDRDQYIQIDWSNIIEGKAHNFEQHLNDGVDIGAYDYQSIMHYSAYAFSKNGQPTIRPLYGSPNIGQRIQLSEKDITALNAIYPPVKGLTK